MAAIQNTCRMSDNVNNFEKTYSGEQIGPSGQCDRSSIYDSRRIGCMLILKERNEYEWMGPPMKASPGTAQRP